MAAKKIIKFYASWCGPCKVYGKTWDRVIPDYQDQINVENIDIDKDITGLQLSIKYLQYLLPYLLEKMVQLLVKQAD